MLNEERRRAILELLNRNGRVIVNDLSRRFRTSRITIRKDLDVLGGRGLIHRAHGGALPNRNGALFDPALDEKERQHRGEKRRIAAAAIEFVKEGQVVVLDSGTTTMALAQALRRFRRLTVITNALNIAADLAGSSVDVILTGGNLRNNSFSLVGPLAEESLRQLRADVTFLAVDGFDVRYGLTTPNLQEAAVNRTMVAISRRTIVLCDSSKFGRRSLSLIVPVASVHHTITDRKAPRKDVGTLRKAGVAVTLV